MYHSFSLFIEEDLSYSPSGVLVDVTSRLVELSFWQEDSCFEKSKDNRYPDKLVVTFTANLTDDQLKNSLPLKRRITTAYPEEFEMKDDDCNNFKCSIDEKGKKIYIRHTLNLTQEDKDNLEKGKLTNNAKLNRFQLMGFWSPEENQIFKELDYFENEVIHDSSKGLGDIKLKNFDDTPNERVTATNGFIESIKTQPSWSKLSVGVKNAIEKIPYVLEEIDDSEISEGKKYEAKKAAFTLIGDSIRHDLVKGKLDASQQQKSASKSQQAETKELEELKEIQKGQLAAIKEKATESSCEMLKYSSTFKENCIKFVINIAESLNILEIAKSLKIVKPDFNPYSLFSFSRKEKVENFVSGVSNIFVPPAV